MRAAAARHDALVMTSDEREVTCAGLIIMESGKPSVPQVTPKSDDRPPEAYLYFLLATGVWSLGWPMVYIVLEATPAPQSPVIHEIEVIGGVSWGLALFGFWVILSLLSEYSPTLSFFLDALWFVLEVLLSMLG